MRVAGCLVAPLGIALVVISAPAWATEGVRYVIGGHTLVHDSRVLVLGATPQRSAISTCEASAAGGSTGADSDAALDTLGVRGVVFAGATLAPFNQTSRPRASACADCNYATMEPLIGNVSRAAGVDPALVAAVIEVESGFNRRAVSPAGAQGLMQLMPATAQGFGVSDVYDPVQNVAAGTLYLGQMLRQFSGNLSYALVAYNAGEANVRTTGASRRSPKRGRSRAYCRATPHSKRTTHPSATLSNPNLARCT